MRRYTQLTQEQRYQIEALRKAGLTQTEIAEQLGVHKSTISREVRRNRGQRGYRAKQAHRLSRVRHHRPGVRIQAEEWQKGGVLPSGRLEPRADQWFSQGAGRHQDQS